MEEKCFVNGCKNQVTVRWEILDSMTASCSIHKILDNNIIARSHAVDSNIPSPHVVHKPKHKFFPICFQSILLLGLLYILFQAVSEQAENINFILTKIETLEKSSDMNYRFYSEILSIRQLLENPEIPSSSLRPPEVKTSIDQVVKNIKEEVSIFSAAKYTKEFSKKESLIILSNPNTNLLTRVEILVKMGIFFDESKGEILSISFLESSSELLIGSLSGALNLCNLTTLEYTNVNTGKFRVYSISPSIDYSTAVVSGDGSLHILSLSSMKYIKTITAHNHWILTTFISEDNKWLVTGSCDKIISIWDHSNFKLDGNLIGHIGDVWSVVISPDNLYLASSGEDKLVMLWDFTKRTLLMKYTGHTAPVYSVCLTRDSKAIVSGSGDGTIRIWDTAANNPPEILIHKGMIRTVMLVGNDKYLISCAEKTLNVWNFKKRTLKFELVHTASLISARVSPDLKWIVSGDVENRLWIWEMSSGELKWVFGGTKEGIKKIEVSDDFKWIIVADYGIVRIWNTENHKLAAVLNKKSQISDWDHHLDLNRFAAYLY